MEQINTAPAHLKGKAALVESTCIPEELMDRVQGRSDTWYMYIDRNDGLSLSESALVVTPWWKEGS